MRREEKRQSIAQENIAKDQALPQKKEQYENKSVIDKLFSCLSSVGFHHRL